MKHQSPHYIRSVKRMTETVKTLRGLSKIPRALPKSNTESFRLGKADSAKDAQKRQEEYVKRTQFRVDKETIAFFLEPYTLSSNSES